MAGFRPDEGEALSLNMILMATNVATFATNADRGADLELGLFTNAAPAETITEATITEPTGTGYARINLTDASWTGSADSRAYAQQTFTGGAGGWTGSIQGYFIATIPDGSGTARLLVVEVDASGPYTIAENDTYKITPNITAT